MMGKTEIITYTIGMIVVLTLFTVGVSGWRPLDVANPSKDSAIELLKACQGKTEIILNASGSVLISCSVETPAPAEKAPTSKDKTV